jgi:Domain of Unknown Function (DUF1259)
MLKRTLIVATFATALMTIPALAADPDWTAVGQALGKTGTVMPGGVYRVALPRTDLHVTLDGVDLKAGFALGGWVAFEPMGDQAMVMGDLVLAENEISPVMQKMEQQGIEITALHNHLLRASPPTFYMHVLGQGDPVKLAQALHDGLALSHTPFAAPAAAPASAAPDLDVAAIDKIMSAQGKANNGVVGYSFPRAEKIEDNGMPVPPAMGSAIAINFQPTGGGKAAITGDFVLLGQEVNPVLRVLRESGIEVTALHSHMIDEQPRLFFMHFWANDDAAKLAKGLRAAIDKVNVAHS